MNYENLMQYASFAAAVISVMAFLVAAIVQTIKEVTVFRKLPTNGVALVVSMIVCPTVTVLWCAWKEISMTWYSGAAAVIAAFPVYLAATGGWDKVHDIWKKTHPDTEISRDDDSTDHDGGEKV